MNTKPRYARPAGLNDDLRQFSLGDLIERLSPIPLMQEPWGERLPEPKTVRFDFGNTMPIELSSYRGSYEELSIIYSGDYDKRLTVEQFLARLKTAVGETFQGWKGGDFVMDTITPLWVVSEPRNMSETVIVGVRDLGHTVVLDTAWCES